MSTQLTNDSSLKHGQFKVTMNTSEDPIECLVCPLTQNDLANGWQQILPQERKNSIVHHFSIYLSQLPPHLWTYIKLDRDSEDHYETIHDNIYHYSIKKSKYDDQVLDLYKVVMSKSPNLAQLSQCYNRLNQQRIKGWIMIKAETLLHENGLTLY